jgi:hypothetical protein
MKVTGRTRIDGTPEEVFEHLLDAQVLRTCIPGCESLERTGQGAYDMLVRAGVGSVKGSFKGTVALEDVVAPSGYRMTVEGKSTVGYVRGGARVTLAADGDATAVSWEGEAKVSGVIASMGGRLLEVAAKSVTNKFFSNLMELRGTSAS